MKSIYLEGNTIAIIPDSWTAESDGNMISVFEAANGVGALQFTSFKVPNRGRIDLSKELLSLLDDEYNDADINEKANYAFFETVDKDSVYWKYWLLNGEESIFFISYNCQATDKGIENDVINSIINSII